MFNYLRESCGEDSKVRCGSCTCAVCQKIPCCVVLGPKRVIETNPTTTLGLINLSERLNTERHALVVDF